MARKARQKQSWELAAEELVRQTRMMLDNGRVIEDALASSGMGRAMAAAQMRQLDRLCEALELELLQAAEEPRTILGLSIAGALRGAGRTIASTVLVLGTTEAYQHARSVEAQADVVARECEVVLVEEASSSGTGELQGGGLEAHAHGTFEPAPSPAATGAADGLPDADHDDIASELEQLAQKPYGHYVVGPGGELIPTREHQVGDDGELIERELTDQVGAQDSGQAAVTPDDGPDPSQA